MIKYEKKPVFGCQLLVCPDHTSVKLPNLVNGKIIVYCKNLDGWKSLLEILYYYNNPERSKKISISEIAEFDLTNLICVGVNLNIAQEKECSRIFKDFYKGVNPYHGYTNDNFLGVPITDNLCIDGRLDLVHILHKNNRNDAPFPNHANIHSYEELKALGFDDAAFKRTLEIFDKIEQFDIKKKQILPQYHSLGGLSESEFIEKKCESELIKRGLGKPYKERLKYELAVIKKAGMAGYFLIVQDITNFLLKRNRLIGVGRGSAGGCLISYLLNITQVDPIKYDLLFERFYSDDRGSFPDIDIDIPPSSRDSLVQYIYENYGEDKFAQLCTFNTLKGAAALKAALRVSPQKVPAYEQNEITKDFQKEGVIDADLKDQEKKHGTRSMVLWTLMNEPKKVSKWCILENENFSGVYAKEFEQAIKLDKVIASIGKHASAFVISNEPLYKQAPLIWDEHYVVGTEMNSSEALGLLKLDLLGLDLVEKAEYMREVLKNGSICKSKSW